MIKVAQMQTSSCLRILRSGRCGTIKAAQCGQAPTLGSGWRSMIKAVQMRTSSHLGDLRVRQRSMIIVVQMWTNCCLRVLRVSMVQQDKSSTNTNKL